jgi:hypothetical protein
VQAEKAVMANQRDYEALVYEVETSYAGYHDKTVGREEELARLTESVHTRVAGLADSDADGVLAALREWIGFFRDRHLTVRFPPDPEHPANPVIDDRRSELVLEAIEPDAMRLRIPGFAITLKPPLDALLRDNWSELTTRRFLIIDLRGSDGGSDVVCQELVPLLYTDPIRVIGSDFRGSAESTRYLRSFGQNDALPPEIREWAGRIADQMDAAPGSFVPGVPDQDGSLDEVLPRPERIGVMIDGRCSSAVEQFLLLARQSRKVTLFGSHTAGCLDYSNVRPTPLPSRRFLLGVPISRSRRLPENPVDPTGILPDVPIPESEADPVGFVLNRLRSPAA